MEGSKKIQDLGHYFAQLRSVWIDEGPCSYRTSLLKRVNKYIKRPGTAQENNDLYACLPAQFPNAVSKRKVCEARHDWHEAGSGKQFTKATSRPA